MRSCPIKNIQQKNATNKFNQQQITKHSSVENKKRTNILVLSAKITPKNYNLKSNSNEERFHQKFFRNQQPNRKTKINLHFNQVKRAQKQQNQQNKRNLPKINVCGKGLCQINLMNSCKIQELDEQNKIKSSPFYTKSQRVIYSSLISNQKSQSKKSIKNEENNKSLKHKGNSSIPRNIKYKIISSGRNDFSPASNANEQQNLLKQPMEDTSRIEKNKIRYLKQYEQINKQRIKELFQQSFSKAYIQPDQSYPCYKDLNLSSNYQNLSFFEHQSNKDQFKNQNNFSIPQNQEELQIKNSITTDNSFSVIHQGFGDCQKGPNYFNKQTQFQSNDEVNQINRLRQIYLATRYSVDSGLDEKFIQFQNPISKDSLRINNEHMPIFYKNSHNIINLQKKELFSPFKDDQIYDNNENSARKSESKSEHTIIDILNNLDMKSQQNFNFQNNQFQNCSQLESKIKLKGRVSEIKMTKKR